MKIVTDAEQLTYSEVILFQQYFAQITQDIDIALFDQMKQNVFKSLNENNIAQAILHIHNFDVSLKIQEFGTDAWKVCYAILIDKKEPELNKDKLIEIYNELAKDKKQKEVKDAVVNFSKASPLLYLSYLKRAEGLNSMTDLFLKNN